METNKRMSEQIKNLNQFDVKALAEEKAKQVHLKFERELIEEKQKLVKENIKNQAIIESAPSAEEFQQAAAPIQQEIGTIQNEIYEQEIQKAQFETLRKRHMGLVSKNGELTNLNADLSNDIQIHRAYIPHLNEMVENEQKKAKATIGRKVLLEQTYRGMQHKEELAQEQIAYFQNQEKEKQKLENRINVQNMTNSALDKQKPNETTIKEHAKAIAVKQSELEKAETIATNLRNAIKHHSKSQVEVTELARQLVEKEAQISQLKATLPSTNDTREVTKEFAAKSVEIIQRKGEYDRALKQHTEHEKLKNENDELQRQIDVGIEKINELDATKPTQDQIKEVTRTKATSEQKLYELGTQMDLINNENDDYRKQIRDTEELKRKYENQIAAKNAYEQHKQTDEYKDQRKTALNAHAAAKTRLKHMQITEETDEMAEKINAQTEAKKANTDYKHTPEWKTSFDVLVAAERSANLAKQKAELQDMENKAKSEEAKALMSLEIKKFGGYDNLPAEVIEQQGRIIESQQNAREYSRLHVEYDQLAQRWSKIQEEDEPNSLAARYSFRKVEGAHDTLWKDGVLKGSDNEHVKELLKRYDEILNQGGTSQQQLDVMASQYDLDFPPEFE
jgi:hypothetical protein